MIVWHRRYNQLLGKFLALEQRRRRTLMIQYQLLKDRQFEMSISSLVQRAQNQGKGPIPQLYNRDTTMLGQGQHGVIVFGGAPLNVVAFGLITCAGVILVSTAPNEAAQAVVYHATSGTLSAGILATLHAAIGNPPLCSLLAVYATPKTWDKNYHNDAMKIQTFGVPANRVVYIDNLPRFQFGIDYHGHVGC